MVRLDDLIAPMALTTFIKNYLSQRPVAFYGPREARSMLTTEEINATLDRLTVRPDTMRVWLNGVPLRQETYITQDHHPAINRSALHRYLESGATVMLDFCQGLFPGLHSSCEALGEALRAHVEASVVLVRRPGKPIGQHWDGNDVLVCQVSGCKRWPIFRPVREKPLAQSRYGDECSSELIDDVLLQPGDALYIPRGWPHNPEGIGGPSVHVTFQLARPTGVDLLRWIAADLNSNCADIRDDLPLLHSDARRQDFAIRLRRAIEAAIQDDALEAQYRTFEQKLWAARVSIPHV